MKLIAQTLRTLTAITLALPLLAQAAYPEKPLPWSFPIHPAAPPTPSRASWPSPWASAWDRP